MAHRQDQEPKLPHHRRQRRRTRKRKAIGDGKSATSSATTNDETSSVPSTVLCESKTIFRAGRPRQVDRLWLLPSAHLSGVVTNGPSCLPYPLLCVYFVCVFCCLLPNSKFWLRVPGLSSLQAHNGNLNRLLLLLTPRAWVARSVIIKGNREIGLVLAGH